MKQKKPRDWKFIFGITLLAAVMILMSGSFWMMVGRQAEIDRENERREAENVRKVIVLKAGDELKYRIFLDMESKEVFEADVPKEGIYNTNLVLIKGDELLYGDIIRVYGDNELTGDGVPFYHGITKMERVSRADLEEANRYQEIADQAVAGLAET